SFILVEGVFEGIAAAAIIALPYIIPFAIALAILEDSGYLARMAFLMDTFMRKIGLHGKAFIPMILGYGCTVPACLSCRIMETQRERFLSAFLVTLVPCAARSVIIMGLVAAFVGIEWAAFLYLLNILIIAILGRIAFRALPGEPMGLIMEMPSYKMPSPINIAKTAWLKANSFIWIALPIIIASTVLIKLVEFFGLIGPISDVLSPITVGWLGLPAIAGITLIFGILRKELALVMLAALLGTENFSSALTQVQMLTFAIVSMYYVPCTATIAALAREFGWKKSLAITVFEVMFAILLAGVLARILEAFFF
ncbi:MAG TPA: nucleoside recognition domain-containing protein, partial [Candidatus Bilamarchaeaceae archaeon]|nr:nucleoside recognition domain-containing protein [Candidatus Bilamarchaeaceae archaeon]